MKKLILAVAIALTVIGGTVTFVNFGTPPAYAGCEGGCG